MKNNIVKVGDTFGRWTVLEIDVINPKSKAKRPPKMAKCQCSCSKHTIRYKEYRDLVQGRSLSCGCLRNEQTAQRNKENSSVKVGMIFNNSIEVLEDLGMRSQARGKNESWYRCRCLKCGRTDYEVNGTNVKYVNSCGCVTSKGENIIKNILDQNQIQYLQEYKFKDLYGKDASKPYRFYFAIFEKDKLLCLIEFDGRQHFVNSEGIWKMGYSLEETQQRDKEKTDYCKKNNYKLIRIPYTDLNKIDWNYLKEKIYKD